MSGFSALRSFAVTLLLASTALLGFGQGAGVVNGYVVDVSTDEVIPYATIYLSKAKVGTATDFSGYFEIPVDNLDENDTLFVSSVGYLQLRIAIKAQPVGQVRNIYLSPSTTRLKEFTVMAESVDPRDIIRRAVANKRQNLMNKPHLIGGLYREIVKKDGTYAGLSEADGQLYLGGYQKVHTKDRVPDLTYDVGQWKQVRRSDYNITDDLHPDRPRKLSVNKLLLLKEAYTYKGPVSKAGIRKFNFTVQSLSSLEGEPVFVIAFEPSDPNQSKPYGTVSIKGSDYAVTAMEVFDDFDRIEPRKPGKADFEFTKCSFTIRYSHFEGHYYLNHMRLTSSYKVAYPDQPDHNRDVEEFLELVGGKFSDQEAPALDYAKRVVLFHEMNNPLINFSPDFWVKKHLTYEMAFGTVVTHLASQESLDIQYLFHHGKRIYELPKGFRSYEHLYRDKQAYSTWLNLEP